MKNIIIIHGYGGPSKILKWVKNKLKNTEFNVIIPLFPKEEQAFYQSWQEKLDNYRKYFNPDTIIIAHSLGNSFIIKYLKEKNLKIDIFISLAGFIEDFGIDPKEDLKRAVKDFKITTEEMKYLKNATNKRFAIYSDSDQVVPFKVLKNYAKVIAAKAILIKNIGHMGVRSEVQKLPQLIELIRANI